MKALNFHHLVFSYIDLKYQEKVELILGHSSTLNNNDIK